jgi:carbon monoxide dehydrogenase subunit G
VARDWVGRITKSIEIEASPEKVFDFMSDMEKLNEITKGVARNEITSKGPVGVGSIGHTILYNKVGGKQAEFDMEVTEFEKNKKVSMRTIGKSKMKVNIKYAFEPTAKGTKLTKTTDYELPYSILGKIIDQLGAHKDMEKTEEKALMDLKKALET